jgi:hypothetical protein
MPDQNDLPVSDDAYAEFAEFHAHTGLSEEEAADLAVRIARQEQLNAETSSTRGLRWIAVRGASALAFWVLFVVWFVHTVAPATVGIFSPPAWLPTLSAAMYPAVIAVLLVITVAGLREAGLLPDVSPGGGGPPR